MSKRTGFTLVELLVVLGIVMLLMGFFMGVVNRARAHSQSIACRSNLHQIGVAVAAYAAVSNGEVIPYDLSIRSPRPWSHLLFNTPNPKVVICPTGDGEERLSYLLNRWLIFGRYRRLQSNRHGVPSGAIVLAGENRPGVQYEYSPILPADEVLPFYDPVRHRRLLTSNYLWLDFHVSSDRPIRRPNARDDWDVPID